MIKRQAFYSNGEMIDYRLPNTFVPSTTKQACGNCAMYSNRRGFCNIYKAFGYLNIKRRTCNCKRQRINLTK